MSKIIVIFASQRSFYSGMTYFLCKKTIIRPPLKNFTTAYNRVQIIFHMWDYMGI